MYPGSLFITAPANPEGVLALEITTIVYGGNSRPHHAHSKPIHTFALLLVHYSPRDTRKRSYFTSLMYIQFLHEGGLAAEVMAAIPAITLVSPRQTSIYVMCPTDHNI
jgi:hypothetical protein